MWSSLLWIEAASVGLSGINVTRQLSLLELVSLCWAQTGWCSSQKEALWLQVINAASVQSYLKRAFGDQLEVRSCLTCWICLSSKLHAWLHTLLHMVGHCVCTGMCWATVSL